MKKSLKILLVIGLSLILLGGGVFLVGFGMTGFDVHALGSVQIKEKRYEESVDNPLTAISLDFDIADFKVNFDEQAENVTITYPQRQNKKGKNLSLIQITESENTVTITETKDTFVPSIFNFVSPTVTLFLPSSRAYDLSIRTDTGDISLYGNATLTSFHLETDTGDVRTTAATLVCEGNGVIETDTGDVKLGDFETQSLSVNADTGDISLMDGKTTDSLSIETDTGDVTAFGLLTASTLSVKTNTGDIEGEDAVLDAETVILSTSTGDITAILTGKQNDYATTVECGAGDTNIVTNLGYITSAARVLKTKTSTGDIFVIFTVNN